jgi:ABC-type glutathione transport system ATPase component
MKSTVVLVTHKPAVLSIVDNIMVMQDGMIAMSGPRQEVLDKLREAQQQQARQQQQQQQARQQLAQSQQGAGGNVSHTADKESDAAGEGSANE